MGFLSNCFPLGLGTAHLPIKNINDTVGIEKSAELIVKAFNYGIDYIDTSYPYAAGGAHAALKLAFERTDKPVNVTAKVIYQTDKTADDARVRVERQLKAMGISKAACFVCWSIQSYEQFKAIIAKGGIYEGAQKLKDEGLIEHICCSLHATPEDSIKIIESSAFEAVTVSFNLANAIQTLPVLDVALKNNIDVSIMNPLGGGGIPKNKDFFSFAKMGNENTVAAALRFVKSHAAVKVVLSGLNSEDELIENIKVFTEKPEVSNSERLEYVSGKIRDIDGYCVNCHYCAGCPVNIPVSKLMNRHNRLLFPNIVTQDYRRSDVKLQENINLFFGQADTGSSDGWFPDMPENPCIKCGQCEKKCTQKLKIIDSIDNLYTRAKTSGYSKQSHIDRLRELIYEKGFKLVGLYPKDRFADYTIKLYTQSFGNPDFKWVAFNSDTSLWGRVIDGLTVHRPGEIPYIKPDIIIICNYTYQEEIYNDLRHFEDNGIKIVKLHRNADVPWVF